jgi:signal transduction histidine kinase
MRQSKIGSIFCGLLLSFFCHAVAQTSTLVDSLLKRLANTKDTSKVDVLNGLCWELRGSEPEKALEYGQQALELASRLSFKGGLVRAYSRVGVIYTNQGNYPKAKDAMQHALDLSLETKNLAGLASSYMNLGNLNFYQSEYPGAIENYSKAIKIYEQLGDSNGISNCMNNTGNVYFSQGNYTKALEYQLKVLGIYRELKNKENEGMTLDNIGAIYANQGDFTRALQNHLAALKIMETLQNKQELALVYGNIGGIYNDMSKYDEALNYFTKALQLNEQLNNKKEQLTTIDNIALIYSNQDKLSLAINFYEKSLSIAREIHDVEGIAEAQAGMASVFDKQYKMPQAIEYYEKALLVQRNLQNREQLVSILKNLSYLYDKMGQHDEALKTAQESAVIAKETGSLIDLKEAKFALSSSYKYRKDYQKALQYYEEASRLKDSIFNENKSREIGRLESGFEMDKKDQQIALLNKDKIIQASKTQQQTVIRNALIGGMSLILILALVLIRNNRHKQQTNLVLTKQKTEIESKRDSLENAYAHLKATQAQLIQSEKMASLGELTAGIAHEIQNPLNFVNNFSEVSNELIEELRSEKSKLTTERDKGLEDEILNDIQQNLQKINHHGRRADAIVKGMLQHSQSSKGVKEPTNINALADEYLRLAYSGFRAKDKEFIAELKTDFNNEIGKINTIPQEIGRVLLNLYNNAFYAVNERRKAEGLGYEPIVSVSTKKTDTQVYISVSDNASGIPYKIVDKIFQPFFTTKPTGQGTGLGLSLTYDIIKAQSGEIKVDTKEGEGTTFTIQLPIV